jgi:hypothetical protein
MFVTSITIEVVSWLPHPLHVRGTIHDGRRQKIDVSIDALRGTSRYMDCVSIVECGSSLRCPWNHLTLITTPTARPNRGISRRRCPGASCAEFCGV